MMGAGRGRAATRLRGWQPFPLSGNDAGGQTFDRSA